MIDEAPLWLVGLILFAAMILAYEGGMWLHERIRRRTNEPAATSSDQSHVMAGVFGMLSLLMAFAFSLALDRYEQRRELVITEANAIETLSSRLIMLPQSMQQQLHDQLANYTVTRVTAGLNEDPQRANVLFAKGEAMHDAFGAQLLAGLAQGPADARTTLLVQAFDAIGDVAAERRAARAARLPDPVLLLLVFYCVAGAGMLGYTLERGGGQHRLASNLFFALLVLAFITVLDLDRPRGGAILVPQDELERVSRALLASQQLP